MQTGLQYHIILSHFWGTLVINGVDISDVDKLQTVGAQMIVCFGKAFRTGLGSELMHVSDIILFPLLFHVFLCWGQ